MLLRKLTGLLLCSALATVAGCRGTASCGHHHSHACHVHSYPSPYAPTPYQAYPDGTYSPPIIEGTAPPPAPPSSSAPPMPALPSESRLQPEGGTMEIAAPIRVYPSLAAERPAEGSEPIESQERLMPIPAEEPGWLERVGMQFRDYLGGL